MFQLTCEVCKRGFDWPHKKQFCSKKCYKESFLIRNPRRSEKSCNLCGEIKNYKLFRHNKSSGLGWMDVENKARNSICKICESNRFKKAYAKDSIPQILSNAKIRAKENNVPFNLTTKYLREILPKDMICPIFKVKMTKFQNNKGEAKRHKHSPSIDRIIGDKGYVEGNVIIVSDIANRIKTDSTMEELEMTYLFYKDLIKKKASN